jgi:uncharacterized membrane protein required for colicin V production
MRAGTGMFWLDTTLVAILLLGALLGARSGLLWQVARLLSLAGALYASVTVNEPMTGYLQADVLQGADLRVARLVAYVAVFVAVYVALYLATNLVYRGLERAELPPVDRLMGSALGLAKAGLLSGAVCWALASWPHPATQDLMEQSAIAPALADGMDGLLHLLPGEWKSEIIDGVQGLHGLTRRSGD